MKRVCDRKQAGGVTLNKIGSKGGNGLRIEVDGGQDVKAGPLHAQGEAPAAAKQIQTGERLA
jgi:hypothetical protein